MNNEMIHEMIDKMCNDKNFRKYLIKNNFGILFDKLK